MDAKSALTLTAYAARRGVSKAAVSQAIKRGRLSASVVRDEHGRPSISDPDLADREWSASTDLSRAPGTVKARAAPPALKPATPPLPPSAEPAEIDPPQLYPGMSLAEASAAEKFWRAKLAEQDYRARAAELVPAAAVSARLAGLFTRCRARLTGIPTRARQRLPHLSHADVATIDDLVREALEQLADMAPAEEPAEVSGA